MKKHICSWWMMGNLGFTVYELSHSVSDRLGPVKSFISPRARQVFHFAGLFPSFHFRLTFTKVEMASLLMNISVWLQLCHVSSSVESQASASGHFGHEIGWGSSDPWEKVSWSPGSFLRDVEWVHRQILKKHLCFAWFLDSLGQILGCLFTRIYVLYKNLYKIYHAICHHWTLIGNFAHTVLWWNQKSSKKPWDIILLFDQWKRHTSIIDSNDFGANSAYRCLLAISEHDPWAGRQKGWSSGHGGWPTVRAVRSALGALPTFCDFSEFHWILKRTTISEYTWYLWVCHLASASCFWISTQTFKPIDVWSSFKLPTYYSLFGAGSMPFSMVV